MMTKFSKGPVEEPGDAPQHEDNRSGNTVLEDLGELRRRRST
jgi:hypothetical protein